MTGNRLIKIKTWKSEESPNCSNVKRHGELSVAMYCDKSKCVEQVLQKHCIFTPMLVR